MPSAVEPASPPVDGRVAAGNAYAEDAAAVVAALGSDAVNGLTDAQGSARLVEHGPNELEREPAAPWWRLVFDQLREVVVVLLLVAAAVAVALDEWIDAGAILFIVAMNACLGLYQQWKAEHALTALRMLSAPLATVVRGGVPRKGAASELVPGDRIELEAGDCVPADARLLSGFGLQTLEAALTGESTAVTKAPEQTLPASTALGDRRNMVFLGTIVAAGKASAIVTATGMETELGRVAGLLSRQASPPTPLQRRIHRLGQMLVVLCLSLVAAIAALQVARGESWLETLRLSVSLAVAAIPEGLPAVLTITLALGAQRLARRQALVRRLSSVETLGSVSVICTDKTGTLTRNEMTVREIWTAENQFRATGQGYDPRGELLLELASAATPHRNGDATGGGLKAAEGDLAQLLRIGVWCNHARVLPSENGNNGWQVIGDPTEGALVVAAHKGGVERSEAEFSVVDEQPFDSDRKMMSVAVRDARGQGSVLVKGAPEAVLAKAAAIRRGGKTFPLTDREQERIRDTAAEMAGRALRVLALAYRDDGRDEPASMEQDLVLAGLVGMIDPPREEASEAIDTCHQAGIRPVMITGDHPDTARAIGRELGLIPHDGDVVTGSELDRFSPGEFDRHVAEAAVFARVTAEHKLRIVDALQRQGQVVAMTGDGVNDAPAVKAADIGIAMGITGADVTKEASAMVLTNDNFTSIVRAVEEGRAIYDNIQKFVQYLLAGNAGKLLFMFFAVLVGWPTPLLPIQILWLNLVTDGLPALALGMDPTHGGLMRRPPRSASEPLIDWRRAWRIVWHGSLTAGVALVGFQLVYRGDSSQVPAAQLTAFCILGFAQLAYSFVCRSEEEPLRRLGWTSNRALLAGTGASLALQLAVVLTPALHGPFGIEAYPTAGEWGLIVVLSLVPCTLLELRKHWRGMTAGGNDE